MKSLIPLCLGATCLALSGCSIITVGAYDEPPRVQMDGWVTAYAAAKGIRPWDNTILKLDVLQNGEVVSAEVWPLAGAGVGFIGARLQVLPFEIAAGTLLYHPKPEDYWTERAPAEPEEPVEENSADD